MGPWNTNPFLLARRKRGIPAAVSGATWSAVVLAGLSLEAYAQFVGTAVLAATGWSPVWSAKLSTAYSLALGTGAVGALLWLIQFGLDLFVYASLKPGKPQAAASKASAPPATPSPPVQTQGWTTPELDSAGALTQRHVTSPYQRSASPYSKLPPVTTPDALSRMQDDFSASLSSQKGVNANALASYTSTPGSLVGTPGSASDWDSVGRTTGYYNPPDVYQIQALAGNGNLPADLPKYHYSLQSTGTVAAVTAMALHPSAPRQVDSVMRRLCMSSTDLRVWAERLRYWTSENVMKPLLDRMAASTTRIAAALQRCQSAYNVILLVRPLIPPSGQWSELELCSDDEINQAVMTLELLLRQQQAQPSQFSSFAAQPSQNTANQTANVATINAALEAVKDYRCLTKVLRGDMPNKGILGNCPPGYLASRISAFASDSCCGKFKWQSGGEWGGREWTRDLPTDTHVLVYLLGAFLSAPFWRFEDTQGMILGTGGPLYVGTLPARKPEAFTAILASKPKKEDMARMKAALLLLTGANGEPLTLLVLDGKPTVSLSGEWACFEKVVLFLVYVKLKLDGKVGPFSLDYLSLESVLDKVPLDTSVRQKRWFGILT